MRVRLLKLAALGSIALAIVVAYLWIRTALVSDIAWSPRTGIALISERGVARLYRPYDSPQYVLFAMPSEFLKHNMVLTTTHFSDDHFEARDIGFELLGFRFWRIDENDRNKSTIEAGWEISIPYWFLLVLALLLPAWRLRVWVARPRSGHCMKCGYDLRASAGKCPECGIAIEAGRVSAVGGEG